MPIDKPTERDCILIDRVLQEAHAALAAGGAGVAALLASPDEIIALGVNTIEASGDMTNHAEMVLLHRVGYQLRALNDEKSSTLRVYVYLQPCLIRSAALPY